MKAISAHIAHSCCQSESTTHFILPYSAASRLINTFTMSDFEQERSARQNKSKQFMFCRKDVQRRVCLPLFQLFGFICDKQKHQAAVVVLVAAMSVQGIMNLQTQFVSIYYYHYLMYVINLWKFFRKPLQSAFGCDVVSVSFFLHTVPYALPKVLTRKICLKNQWLL